VTFDLVLAKGEEEVRVQRIVFLANSTLSLFGTRPNNN